MIEKVLGKIRQAEFLINDWLADNTDKVFEEQPDIDAARGHINDAIELLEELQRDSV
jgi:6-phosphogluconate dehydrogenase (decarboxylating)